MVRYIGSAAATIARLEARIAALEEAVAERSRLLRGLARVLCEEDVMNMSRLTVGQPPLPHSGFGLRGWQETTSVAPAEVDKIMAELWRAAAPPVLD